LPPASAPAQLTGALAHPEIDYWRLAATESSPARGAVQLNSATTAQVAMADPAYYDDTIWIAQKSLAKCAPLIGESSELALAPVRYS
jgi:hypothetical protein